jgi:predicted nucleotide-binding protein
MNADVFISYRREDRDYANAIALALKSAGLKVWWDADLLPGQPWAQQIRSALGGAPIVLGVLSPHSVKSEWVLRELEYAKDDNLIVAPVLVGGLQPEQLPANLAKTQALILDDARPKDSAREIAERLKAVLKTVPRRNIGGEAGGRLAQASAETAREASMVPSDVAGAKPPESIFVIHGHDDDMRSKVTSELERLGVKAIVLQLVRTSDDNLFAKFKAVSDKAKHAIVLISADDVGASFEEYTHPAGGSSRLVFRARQNVILELGYFYGKLGEERVFVFRKAPPASDRIVKSFEDPSDLAGRIFEEFSLDWQAVLRDKLEDAGFVIAR